MGALTQGTIFSCAQAERYPLYPVFGLTITARCDIANEKFPVLNYLPVVELDSWMKVDGADLVQETLYAQLRGSFVSILKQCDIATSVLLSVEPNEIVRQFFEIEDASKAAKKNAERARQIADGLHLISSEDPATPKNELVDSEEKKIIAQTIKNLVQNKNQNFYFLPQIEHNGDNNGYVVLLREVAHISKEASSLIAKGVSNLEWPCKEKKEVSFSHSEFAMPVGQIPSPQLEHLMQCFSFLFGRIGIDDIAESYIADATARFTSLRVE